MENFESPNIEVPIRLKRENKWEDLNALNPEEVTDAEFREWYKGFIKSRLNVMPNPELDVTDVSTLSARQELLNFLSKGTSKEKKFERIIKVGDQAAFEVYVEGVLTALKAVNETSLMRLRVRMEQAGKTPDEINEELFKIKLMALNLKNILNDTTQSTG